MITGASREPAITRFTVCVVFFNTIMHIPLVSMAVMVSLEALPWSRGASRQQCVALVLVTYIETLVLVLNTTIASVLILLKTLGKACVLFYLVSTTV